MIIKILYFASLKEQIGRDADTLEVDQPIRVIDAWQQATGLNEPAENILVAINHEYASIHAMLSDGDEVAFFPPVTGG